MSAIQEYIDEHQDIEFQLSQYMQEFSSHKKVIRENELLKLSAIFLDYVQDLLAHHFKNEEEFIFPEQRDSYSEVIERLINDHLDIQQKYHKLHANYQQAINNNSNENLILDLKKDLLFVAYNLIATINHHTAREDQLLFNVIK
jgi:hemerythrin superfamily protein